MKPNNVSLLKVKSVCAPFFRLKFNYEKRKKVNDEKK